MTIPYLELYKEADGKVRVLSRPWWRFSMSGHVLKEGCLIPRGYGIAYWQSAYDCAICYPLGINVIVAVLRKLYRFIKVPRFFITDQRDRWLQMAMVNADSIGRRTGYRAGYDRGWRQALCGNRTLTPLQRDILIGLITEIESERLARRAPTHIWMDEYADMEAADLAEALNYSESEGS